MLITPDSRVRGGGHLKKAKLFNNAIHAPFFDIALEHVSKVGIPNKAQLYVYCFNRSAYRPFTSPLAFSFASSISLSKSVTSLT